MNFIDSLIGTIQLEISKTENVKEVLYFFLMDLALKSKKLSERKAWELIASLVSLVWKDRKFPSFERLNSEKSEINSLHRENIPRTSGVMYSIKEYELGEAAVRKFLAEKAWKGMPGFNEDGTPWKQEDQL